MEGFRNMAVSFGLDPEMNMLPVEVFEAKGDMTVHLCTCQYTSSSILHMLELGDLEFRAQRG